MKKRCKLVPQNKSLAHCCDGGQSLARRAIVGAVVNLLLIAGRYLLGEFLDPDR